MSLRLLVISDHHLGGDACAVNRGYAPAWALDRVLEAIADAGAHGADALLSTGDLVDDGSDQAYAFALSLLGLRGSGKAPGPLHSTRSGLRDLPVYLVPGNHDPREPWLRNLFPEGNAGEHLDLTWTIGNQPFVFLDLGTSGRAGTLTERSLAHLDEALIGERPVVLVLHHHPVPVGVPWLDRALPDRVDQLWARLGDGVSAVLFGHAHASVETFVDGVPILGTRSTCFQFAASDEPEFLIQPLRYRLLTIDAARVTHEQFEVPLTGPATSRRAA